MTSRPSMSGRPEVEDHQVGLSRSRRRAARPRRSSASMTRSPGSSSVMRRKRRIGGSSSMTARRTGRRWRSCRPRGVAQSSRLHRRCASGGASPSGQGEAEHGAAPGPVLGPDAPAVGARRCRGRSPAPARCRAARAPSSRGRTSRRSASSSPGGRPGPRSATSTSRRRRPRRGRDLDRAPGRRVLDRVVEQVDQHLLDEDGVDRHQRQVARASRCTTRSLQSRAASGRAPRRRPPRAAATPS